MALTDSLSPGLSAAIFLLGKMRCKDPLEWSAMHQEWSALQHSRDGCLNNVGDFTSTLPRCNIR